MKAGSAEEALSAVEEFKRRGTPIALFLVDQRMPAKSGTEFLEEAITHYPDSKRVLLTAYADTEAAIASINTVGLDHYLMKPWDPPEDQLYPVLDDLLSDWQASVLAQLALPVGQQASWQHAGEPASRQPISISKSCRGRLFRACLRYLVVSSGWPGLAPRSS